MNKHSIYYHCTGFVFLFCLLSGDVYAEVETDDGPPSRISKEINGFYSYLPAYVGYTINNTDAANEGELKFQFSVKYELIKNRNWYFAYTQKSFWSIQEDSEPFRETNFAPETFWQYKPEDYDWLEGIQFGIYRHESTGESGPGSHGWDTSYIEATFHWNGVYLIPRIWHASLFHRFDEVRAAPDNPDIFDYYGKWNVTAIYGNKKSNQISIMLQPSPIDDSITYEVQFDISWKKMAKLFNKLPFVNFEPEWNPYYFIQVRDGYGASLKSYNIENYSVIFGISLVR